MSKLGTMVLIPVDGDVIESTIDAGKPEELLATVRAALDDYLEVVPRFDNWEGHRCVMFCGETGKIKGLPCNRQATALWWLQARSDVKERYGVGDWLAGPVVVVYGPPEFMRAL